MRKVEVYLKVTFELPEDKSLLNQFSSILACRTACANKLLESQYSATNIISTVLDYAVDSEELNKPII